MYRYRISCTAEQVGHYRHTYLDNKIVEISMPPSTIHTYTFIGATLGDMSFIISPRYLTYLPPIIHTKV